ncbi:MAG: DUF3090 family protein [Actinomycetota bacterium]
MTSYDLPSPDVVTAGTVGPPGQRVFYVQVRDGSLVVTLRCEKQQVAALAEYLGGLLDDLEPAPVGPSPSELDLAEPVDAAWTVGTIGVAYDEPADRIVVLFEELTDQVDEPDPEDDPLEPTTAGASVRVRLTREQAAAFVRRGRDLVVAGRPPCRFCGFPIDPDGHACPRMN